MTATRAWPDDGKGGRREFLGRSVTAALSAGTVLSGGLCQPAHATPETATRWAIKKAVKFHMIREPLSVLGKFQLLRELGFDGTEIHATTKVDVTEVVQAVERTGVVVHGYLNSSRPDLRHAIDQARALGATSVLVVAGRVDKDHSYDAVYREQQARLRRALPYAERHSIRLLVENVWNHFLLSPLEMARFLDELESPAAGAYFDVGNVVRLGWPEQWIRILGKRIGKLDIKEYSRKKQRDEGLWKGFDVELGEGDCDWPAVCAALREIGYFSGWATAEVKGGDRRRLADIAERMDRILEISPTQNRNR